MFRFTARMTAAASALAVAALSLSAPVAQAATPGSDPGGRGVSASAPSPGATIDVRSADGTVVGTLHTMTSEEIRSRGLADYATVSPASPAPLDRPTPTRVGATSSEVTAAASGCWTFTFKQPGWLGMDGYGSEDWCGSGGAITYVQPACWGTDGWYPTYNYLGCSMTKYYGVGWNVADTLYNFDFCIAWWGGGCAKHRHLWDRYRYGATGGVWLISYGG